MRGGLHRNALYLFSPLRTYTNTKEANRHFSGHHTFSIRLYYNPEETMMLATSAIATTAAVISSAAASMFSPSSRTTCKKRVAPSRFRYEPYSARVLGPVIMTETPTKRLACAAAEAFRATAPAPVEPIATVTSPLKTSAIVAPNVKVGCAATAVRFAIVQFKHESTTFIAPFRIATGDVVVVEGDRGENIGVVAEITKDAPSYNVVSRILRKATDKDREALALQRQREAAATASTRALAESLGLHGRVEDAEYQFDMNKLTIFVRRATKSTFVDFRKLQRTLFREFRCRIWCAYMDEVEAAEAAPRCR